MKRIIQLLLLLLSFGQSQTEKYGGGPNTFYQLQTSSREVSLGYTGISSSKGPFSIYWNPAGISIDTISTVFSLNYPFSVNSNQSFIKLKYTIDQN